MATRFVARGEDLDVQFAFQPGRRQLRTISRFAISKELRQPSNQERRSAFLERGREQRRWSANNC
jgi:hypothetical protein